MISHLSPICRFLPVPYADLTHVQCLLLTHSCMYVPGFCVGYQVLGSVHLGDVLPELSHHKASIAGDTSYSPS